MTDTETVLITKVVPQSTALPHLTQYVIYATTVDQDLPRAYQTISDWRASICRRGLELQRPVAIESERTAFGLTIRAVQIVEAA